MMIHIDDGLESDCYVVKYSIWNAISAFKIELSTMKHFF